MVVPPGLPLGAGAVGRADFPPAGQDVRPARPDPSSADRLVVIPYVPGMLDPRVPAACQGQAASVALVELDPADPYDYAQLVVKLWEAGTGFMIVEQDVCPCRGQVADMLGCGRPWCWTPYWVGRAPGQPLLGCTAFSDALAAQHPGLARKALQRPSRGRFWAPWWAVNECLERRLFYAGVGAHRHGPAATHFHQYT